ncbi:hypothetical protein DB30_07016 [Enhygromyxa salina]|uniref:Uncharacterized protein n=1 Tax=Enhygromyxa salina TaxID=215803 RepID=A0A0C2D2B1_9BACT|nr:hypothetical protein DB30_07016 [Enhygromyxa salina]
MNSCSFSSVATRVIGRPSRRAMATPDDLEQVEPRDRYFAAHR